MSRPSWLEVGTALEDPDGERWLIYSVEYEFVRVEDTEGNGYRLEQEDLVRWVNRGAWEIVGGPSR